MSTPMIYEAEAHGTFLKGNVCITTGLEFMKNVAIDTHFIERGRIVRTAQCIETNPGCIGIGFEEDTAVYVTEGRELLVVGIGLMTVVGGMNLKSTDIYEIGTGKHVVDIALEVGVSHVSVHQAKEYFSDGQEAVVDVIEVATATPKAKMFIENLAAFY